MSDPEDPRPEVLIHVDEYRIECGATTVVVERSARNNASYALNDDLWDVYQYLGDKLHQGVPYHEAVVLARDAAIRIEAARG